LMITKVVPTGSYAGGLLSYLMDEKKDFEIIGGNVVGQNYSQIMRQWRAISQQNTRTDKDTKHITLSPHPFDCITNEQWQEIGEYMVQGLGYTNNLWVLITHKPTESQLKKNPDAPPHVHIMVNTIECEKFTRVSDWKDQFRAEALTREIEKQFNIVPVAPSLEAGERALSTGQKRRMLREEKELLALQPNPKIKLHLLQTTGFPTWQYTEPEPPVQTKLNNLCTIASCDRPPLTEYITRLLQCDVEVRIATLDGSPVGISYQMDGVSFAGSSINKKFNWNGLQQQGITFDTDKEAIEGYFKELGPKTSPRQQIKELVEAAANNAQTMSCFLNRCEAAGVEVRIKRTRTGKIQGIAYALGEEEVKGSELKGLSFEKLIAAGVTYDLKRDEKEIAASANKYKAARTARSTSTPLQAAENATTTSTLTPDSFDAAFSSRKATRLTLHDLEALLDFLNEIEARLNPSSQQSLTDPLTPAQAPPSIQSISAPDQAELNPDSHLIAVAASPVETPEVQQPTPADPLTSVRQHLASILPTALEGREPWEQEMLKEAIESLSKSKQLTGKLLLATFGKENQYRVLFYDKFLSIRPNTQGIAENLLYSSFIDQPATRCNFSDSQKREFYPLIEEFSPQPPANDIPTREATVKESSRIKQDKEQTTPGQSTFRLPLPEGIKAQRAYLKSVYQKFSHLCTKQFSLRRDEDIDVGVALWGFIEGLQLDDIKHLLSQSPKVQHFKQQKRPISEMFDYIEQRVTLAITQRQLQADPELSKRVNLVVPIVSSFFEAVPDNQQLEGRNYVLKQLGDIRSVVAKDGRGEVLRLRGRWVERASLEDKDVQLWQQAQENRTKQSQQQQLSPLPKPLKPKSKSKYKKQIELD
jgi:hypothetical protein